jgi:hypothetical protein
MASLYEIKITETPPSPPTGTPEVQCTEYVWTSNGRSYLGEAYDNGEWVVWELILLTYWRRVSNIYAPPASATAATPLRVFKWSDEQAQAQWTWWSSQLGRYTRAIAP